MEYISIKLFLNPFMHHKVMSWTQKYTCVWKLPIRSSTSCYQFSLSTTSLSRQMVACTALVCWQSQTTNVCSRMTGLWSDRSAMSNCKTLSLSCPMSYLRSLALRIWTPSWKREGSLHWYGHMERSNAAVKTACDLQVDGKHGPGRPKMT